MVIFALFYCLLDLRSGECNVVSLYVLCCPVNGSVCFVCCVWLEVLYWIEPVWSSIECVCCACGPSERLDAPSICFVCVFVCRKLSPHLGDMRTGCAVCNVVCLCLLFCSV